jgi:hypothetical protein
MGHPKHDLVHTQFRGPVHHGLEARDHGFETLDTEALAGGPLGGEKTFKVLGVAEWYS